MPPPPAPTPFFDPRLRLKPSAPPLVAQTAAVSAAASAIFGESSGRSVHERLSRGLGWISRELGGEASPSAPRELHALLFPPEEKAERQAAERREGGRPGGGQGPQERSPGRGGDAAERRRRELLGEGRGAAAAEGAAATREARRADRLAQLRSKQAGAAASAMNESLSAAQERGEKLAQVGDKAENLAHEADEFASLAKQLRRQQEGGFFGGLFG